MSQIIKRRNVYQKKRKKKLLDSMTIDEIVEFDDLNKEAEETQVPEEAAKINGMKILLKQKIKEL